MKSILPPLALALIAGSCFPATAQDAPAKPTRKSAPPTMIEICFEMFSLPLVDATSLYREALPDTVLYERILKMIGDGDATQQAFVVTRTLPGQRTTTEAIAEQIYPTEFEKPELPNSLTLQIAPPPAADKLPENAGSGDADRSAEPDAPDFPATPATPTSFETRNTGITLEVEPNISSNSRFVHLRMAPEYVTRVGDSSYGQGLSETKMPDFESQRISTSLVVTSGRPGLIGTISRPPASKVDPDSASTTWFAFVTPRLIVAD